MEFKTEGAVKIIYEHGQPKGIRDKRGFLLFFPKVIKWNNQEERYVKELQESFALAEKIRKALS